MKDFAQLRSFLHDEAGRTGESLESVIDRYTVGTVAEGGGNDVDGAGPEAPGSANPVVAASNDPGAPPAPPPPSASVPESTPATASATIAQDCDASKRSDDGNAWSGQREESMKELAANRAMISMLVRRSAEIEARLGLSRAAAQLLSREPRQREDPADPRIAALNRSVLGSSRVFRLSALCDDPTDPRLTDRIDPFVPLCEEDLLGGIRGCPDGPDCPLQHLRPAGSTVVAPRAAAGSAAATGSGENGAPRDPRVVLKDLVEYFAARFEDGNRIARVRRRAAAGRGSQEAIAVSSAKERADALVAHVAARRGWMSSTENTECGDAELHAAALEIRELAEAEFGGAGFSDALRGAFVRGALAADARHASAGMSSESEDESPSREPRLPSEGRRSPSSSGSGSREMSIEGSTDNGVASSGVEVPTLCGADAAACAARDAVLDAVVRGDRSPRAVMRAAAAWIARWTPEKAPAVDCVAMWCVWAAVSGFGQVPPSSPDAIGAHLDSAVDTVMPVAASSDTGHARIELASALIALRYVAGVPTLRDRVACASDVLARRALPAAEGPSRPPPLLAPLAFSHLETLVASRTPWRSFASECIGSAIQHLRSPPRPPGPRSERAVALVERDAAHLAATVAAVILLPRWTGEENAFPAREDVFVSDLGGPSSVRLSARAAQGSDAHVITATPFHSAWRSGARRAHPATGCDASLLVASKTRAGEDDDDGGSGGGGGGGGGGDDELLAAAAGLARAVIDACTMRAAAVSNPVVDASLVTLCAATCAFAHVHLGDKPCALEALDAARAAMLGAGESAQMSLLRTQIAGSTPRRASSTHSLSPVFAPSTSCAGICGPLRSAGISAGEGRGEGSRWRSVLASAAFRSFSFARGPRDGGLSRPCGSFEQVSQEALHSRFERSVWERLADVAEGVGTRDVVDTIAAVVLNY